ncbi:MAG: AAA family ATPase [Bacillota bacterium]
MKNITKVEIKNFQSHQQTTIEFAQGFNVITGPSDEGKSAIVRALNWVFYNEPAGTDYIRVGASRCEVKVTFNTGYQIIRSRTPSNSRNRYELITPEGKKSVFEKVGRDVPQEIINVHGMPKIEFDQDFKMNLNFDHQLGGPFLLKNSQANSAKVIGGLLDVHLVDSAIRETANDLATQKRQEQQLEEDKLEIENKLQEFDHLPDLAAEIEKKEDLFTKIKNYKSRLDKLDTYKSDLEEKEKKIKRYNQINSELQNLEQANKLLLKIKNNKKRLEKLKKLFKKWNEINKTKEKIRKLLLEVKDIEKSKDFLSRAQNKLDKYQRLDELEKNYQKHQQRIALGNKYMNNFSGVEQVKGIRKKLIKDYDKLMRLKEISNKLSKTRKGIKKRKRLINNLPTKKEEQELKNKVDKKLSEIERLKELKNQQEKLLTDIQQKKSKVKQNKKQVKKLVEDYSELLRQAGRCPTCFSEINENLINSLINNYKEGF